MTGDITDMRARLRANLPPWFPQSGSSPVVDGVLTGVASGLAFVYAAILFARAQMRLATVQGGWLDLWTWDYLGGRYVRKLTEGDDAWRARARIEILRERNTRNAIKQVLLDLTGHVPAIFEPSLPLDTGGYSQPGMLAYGVNGAYGSLQMPWTGIVGAFRQSTSGIPNASGYGTTKGGYGQPSQLCWNDLSAVQGLVTDQDIFAAVESVRPAAVFLTTGISGQVTLVPLTDEIGIALTDEAGNQLYQD